MKKLYLITNDKVWLSKNNYTSNNDLNNILTCFSSNYKICLICRRSKKKFNYKLDQEINLTKVKHIDEKKINLFMISITPFNFFIFVLLCLRNIKLNGFVYLRSDGFMEYKIKYGLIGYFFYFFMFYFIKKKLKIISCSKQFTKVNTKKIVHPSELDYNWLKKRKIKKKTNTDFLYVGRFKKEKGAIFISNIFKRDLKKYRLTMVGKEKKMINKDFYCKNIKFLGPISDTKKLIKVYDASKIFIILSRSSARESPILFNFSRISAILALCIPLSSVIRILL